MGYVLFSFFFCLFDCLIVTISIFGPFHDYVFSVGARMQAFIVFGCLNLQFQFLVVVRTPSDWNRICGLCSTVWYIVISSWDEIYLWALSVGF